MSRGIVFDYAPYEDKIGIEALVVLSYAAALNGSITVANSTSGKNFVISSKYPLKKDNTPREIAKWDKVIKDMVQAGLIELESNNKGNKLYLVTSNGYDISDQFSQQNNLNTNISPIETIEMLKRNKST